MLSIRPCVGSCSVFSATGSPCSGIAFSSGNVRHQVIGAEQLRQMPALRVEAMIRNIGSATTTSDEVHNLPIATPAQMIETVLCLAVAVFIGVADATDRACALSGYIPATPIAKELLHQLRPFVPVIRHHTIPAPAPKAKNNATAIRKTSANT